MTRALVPLAMDLQPDEMPSEDVIRALDVSDKDFADFVTAFKYSIFRSQGDTITMACRKVGLARSTIYEERWQVLLSKAQRLIIGRLSTNITAANNHVFDNWQQMIQMAVRDGLNPDTPARDRVDVLEFLYVAVIQPAKDERRDDSQERAYLQSLTPGQLNPLTPLQFTQINIGVTNEVPVAPDPRTRDFVDATVVDETTTSAGDDQASDT